MAQTQRSSGTTRSTNSRSRVRQFRTAIVRAVREPQKTRQRVLDGATRQLERVSDGLDQAAQITRRAGDALEELSLSLLRASEQLRSTDGGSVRGRVTPKTGIRSTSVRGRKLVASTRRGRRTTKTSRRTPTATTTSGEDLRVAGVGA